MYKVIVAEVSEVNERANNSGIYEGDLRGVVGPVDYVNRRFNEAIERFGNAYIYINEDYEYFEDACARLDQLVETDGVIAEEYLEFD